MRSDFTDPVNVGSHEMVTIDRRVDICDPSIDRRKPASA
jgi:hypothetical protein